jgi:membrane protein required for colicin V production
VSDLPVTIADAGIFLVILLSAILAFARGFVHEFLSIAAWAGAVLAVIFGLPYLRPIARDFITLPLLADAVAGTAIFIVALLILSFVTRALSGRVRDSALNAVDRSLGAVFGLARGALLVCLAYLPVEWLMPPPEQPAWLREARVMPLITEGANWIKAFVRQEGDAGGGETLAERLRRDLERERLARDIMSPEPKSPKPPGDAQTTTYSEKDRRGLERLLDSSR